MIKEIKSYALPQINIYESHHKIEIPVLIPGNSNLLKEVVDPYTGKKIKKLFAGTIYPSNDANAQGIVVNDYFSYNGEDINASICVHGVVANWRLPERANINSKNAMKLIEVRDHAFGLKPELLTKNEKFSEGSKKIITAVILLSSGEFLPGVVLKSNWALWGAENVEIENIVLKSRNLITMSLNVEKATFNDKFPEKNCIQLKINGECTTYKADFELITVGELIGEYHIPKIYCNSPLDFVWGKLDNGTVELELENANFTEQATKEDGWQISGAGSDFCNVVHPDSITLKDNKITFNYTFKGKTVKFTGNETIVTVLPKKGTVDIEESAFKETQIIKVRKE